MYVVALLVACVAGVSMAVQGSLNTSLSKVVGLLEATFVVHIVGIALLLVSLFVLRLGKGNLGLFTQAPWYFYLGGALGVVILYTVVFSIGRVGVATATTAIIVGQVGAALLIDQCGFFGLERVPFTWHKAVGLILLAAGAKFMLLR